MPNEKTKKFYNPDDNCIYFYDDRLQRYMKICDVGAFAKLPFIIKQQIKAVKEEAKQVVNLPTD